MKNYFDEIIEKLKEKIKMKKMICNDIHIIIKNRACNAIEILEHCLSYSLREQN